MSEEKRDKSKIYGRVFSEGGAILSGAKITCDGFETTALADGTYLLDGVPPGEFEVKASLQGFKPESRRVSVKDGEAAVLNFSLAAAVGAGKISGHVYDEESGEPITDGTVILILPIANKYARINKDGYYEFANLSPGDYKLSASAPEYEDCEAALTVADGESKSHGFRCKARRAVEPSWG